MSADVLPPAPGAPPLARIEPPVSWAAIFAGAAAALALGFVLTGLAAGFGLTLLPVGLTASAAVRGFTPTLGACAIAVQVLSAALGGYLAGRLRPEWAIHGDEVHFRDTAHGLIVWAVSTLAGVVLTLTVLGPEAEHVAAAATIASALGPSGAGTDLAIQAKRAADIAAQASFFMSVGMLLSAFVACVAAALGGLRSEEMLARI